MAKCEVVFVLNPAKDLIEDRRAIHDIFGKFGSIFKIFATDRHNTAVLKVYYQNIESAQNAFSELHEKPPYFFKLKVKSEVVYKRKIGDHSLSLTDEGSGTQSNMDDEEVEVFEGPRLFDVYGKEISTFQNDNGQGFIMIEELKRHNFHVFEEDYVPQRITKQDFLQELKIYVSVKVRKFLMLHKQHVLTQQEVDSTINGVIGEYISGKPVPTATNNPQKMRSSNRFSEPLNSRQSMDNNRNDPNKRMYNNNNNNNQPIKTSQPRRSQVNGNVVVDATKENNSPNTSYWSQKPQAEPPAKTRNAYYSLIPDYDIVDIPLNKPLEVSVTCALNDRRCYVYVKAREQHLMSLLRKVQIEAIKSASVTPEVGTIYAALYEGEWYRAQILSINPLKVQYIDFGNENSEALKEVRSLSKELCEIPAEGICINFGNNPINIPLEYGTILNIKACRQNTDKSYQVTKASEKSDELLRKPEAPIEKQTTKEVDIQRSKLMENKSYGQNVSIPSTSKVVMEVESKNCNVNTTPTKVTETLTTKSPETSSKSPEPSAKSPEPSAKNITSTLKEKLKRSEKKVENPPRNTIMDVYTSGVGIVQYLNTVQDNYLCFILPGDSIDTELNRIENITDETITNKNFIANIGECIAVFKQDEDKWVRATVLNKQTDNSYTVALIDYGATETTDKIRKLPQCIADVPEFCCICTGTAKFAKEVQEDTLNFEILDKNKLKVTYSDGSTEAVTCSRWDPFNINKKDVEIDTQEKKQKDPIIMERPKSKVLSSGEIVIISNFNDGKLLVRTKDCYTSYNRLKDSISKFTGNPLKQPPLVNQIVMCPYENSKELHRAMVLKINGTSVEVDYVDLGFVDTIDINMLKCISEQLATADSTLISITLDEFESNDKYNDDTIMEIMKYCDGKTRFTAKLIGNGIFDLLISGTELLSKSLQKCASKHGCFLYEDLPKQDIKEGILNVLCIGNEDIKDKMATFIFKDDITISNLSLITESGANIENNDPYTPITDEVCFGFYDGEWYRARVLTADAGKDEFKLSYIDYGNQDIVSSAQIRKTSEDVKNIPPIALNCKISDFADLTVTTGHEYHMKIINKDEDGFYLINLIE